MSSTRNKVITATVIAGSFITVYHIIKHHHMHQHNDMFDDVDTQEIAQWFEDPKERPFLLSLPKIISNIGDNIGTGSNVVDIGAGTGVLMKHFTSIIGDDGTYIALEISKSFVDHINSSITKENIQNAIVINNTINSFCLPPHFKGKINMFICLNVWHHVEDKKAVLTEIYNNLQNDGVFVLMDFKKFTDKEMNEMDLPNLTILRLKFVLHGIISSFLGHKHSMKEFREMAKKNGFESAIQMVRCIMHCSPKQYKDEILQKSDLVFEKDVMSDVLQDIFVHIYKKK